MYILSCYVYADDDERRFEANVPLRSMGQHLRMRGWANGILLLFLEGFSRFSLAYRRELSALGFQCVDLENDYHRLGEPFSNLRSFGSYEFNNFLRWLGVEYLIRRESLSPTMIHLDGDILFNVSPTEVATDVKDLTFVLQGVPAFVVLGNYAWFESYRRELVQFNADPYMYSAKAWDERAGAEGSLYTKWAGRRDSPRIRSDQDLISHLIHTDRLPQDSPGKFVPHLNFYYAQNPLYLNAFAQMQFGRTWSLNLKVRDNTAYIESLPVALWHMQTDFSDYVRLAAAFRRAHLPLRVPNPYRSKRLRNQVMPRLKLRFLPSRQDVYSSVREFSTEPKNVCLGLTDIFNHSKFWDANAFASSSPRAKPV